MPVMATFVLKAPRKYDLPRDSEGIALAYLGKADDFLSANKSSPLPPVLVLFTEDDEHVIDGRPFMRDGDHREVLAALGRELAVRVGAIASAFLSEAWLALSIGKPLDCPPSRHPERMEAVIAVGEYRGMRAKARALTIVRDPEGKVSSLKPFLMPDGSDFDGRFTGILPGSPP